MLSEVRSGLTTMPAVAAVAALASFLFVAAASRNAASATQVNSGATTSERVSPADKTRDCQVIAAGNSQLTPLVGLCRFALSFRRQLPDFVCEQTTISTGKQSFKTMNEEVTFENGHESYSNVTIDGKAPSEEAAREMKVFSTGELGSNLVDLFEAPIVAEFKFRGNAKIENIRASVYGFHIAAQKNTFWRLRDSNDATLFPEYEGELWIEQQSGRLLRMKLRPVHLPKDFSIISATITTDYSYVLIADAGTFLLPSKSVTDACVRYLRGDSICRKNVLHFHDCRKFGTKSRIITEPSRP